MVRFLPPTAAVAAREPSLRSPLLWAFTIVKSIDGSALRQAIFQEIADRKPVVSAVYALYRYTRRTPLAPLLVGLYGIKTFLAVGYPPPGAEMISIALYPNEERALRALNAIIQPRSMAFAAIHNRYIVHWKSWAALARYITAFPQLARIMAQLTRRYDFMPACRMSATIAYYLRAKHMLVVTQMPGIAIANLANPATSGFRAAARLLGRKIVYTNHAFQPQKAIYTPALIADLAIIHSKAAADNYAPMPALVTPIMYKGLEGASKPLCLDKLSLHGMRIGIFMTSLEDDAVMRSLIEELIARFRPAQLRIRPHPNPLYGAYGCIPELAAKYKQMHISKSTPLAEDIAACDLVICGNSGVVLEILKSGVPVVYYTGLDANPDDYNGFVASDLIPRIHSVDGIDIKALSAFYSGDWNTRMRYYDAGYEQGQAALHADIRAAVEALFTGSNTAPKL